MIQHFDFQAMGSQIHVALDHSSRHAERRLQRVPLWFEEWEQCLSRFRPDSELSRVNAAGGSEATSPTLWEVFQLSLAVERASGGLVNPTLLAALEHAGYVGSFDTLPQYPSPAGLFPQEREIEPVRSEAITWEASRRAISLPEGAGLDFGGVAKGWAAHQACQRLKIYGPALVEAGGDVSVSGLKRNGDPWSVAVNDPFQPDGELERLFVGRSGVATSGKDHRRWQQDGAWQHHLIDPRSGFPAETDLLTVTVVAPDVMEAEMAAKVVFILGSRDGLAWLEARPNLAGLLVLEDGRRIDSSRLQAYLWR